MRTDEPKPRNVPLVWSPYDFEVVTSEVLTRPDSSPSRSFADVIAKRRSAVGNPVDLNSVAELLWWAVGWKGYASGGRAGLPIAWATSPSSGGLQSVNVVCIADDGSAPRLYDPVHHVFLTLRADNELVQAENRQSVLSVTGLQSGCTLRLVSDCSKISAAYENFDSLVFRDAGAVLATICLCAEWLGLAACPLGFLGSAMLPLLGLPQDRFQAVGGVQVSRPRDAKG
ncbi:nitroreductase family protein [Bradyrhizobium sp. CCGB12]|uniref:nitroreductase family protein n=1 Tax=Bradyrhizobium sp. CCGB12 TaxID=2949632 RepID=UPI0020B297BD|nr:nitroreductase family protein [Bradyrhizobium sp. CCGB12]MCP3392022.1 nitroreductase family protein [Bradyrhizobium sp. CCGB12]